MKAELKSRMGKKWFSLAAAAEALSGSAITNWTQTDTARDVIADLIIEGAIEGAIEINRSPVSVFENALFRFKQPDLPAPAQCPITGEQK